MDTFVKKGDVLVTAALFPHSLRLSAEPRTTLIFTSTLLSTMRTTSLSLHGILLAAIIALATPRIAWGAEVQQVSSNNEGDDAKRRSSSDTCRLFMARSTIPNAGIGVFTAVVSMSWFAVCACTCQLLACANNDVTSTFASSSINRQPLAKVDEVGYADLVIPITDIDWHNNGSRNVSWLLMM